MSSNAQFVIRRRIQIQNRENPIIRQRSEFDVVVDENPIVTDGSDPVFDHETRNETSAVSPLSQIDVNPSGIGGNKVHGTFGRFRRFSVGFRGYGLRALSDAEIVQSLDVKLIIGPTFQIREGVRSV